MGGWWLISSEASSAVWTMIFPHQPLSLVNSCLGVLLVNCSQLSEDLNKQGDSMDL